MHLEGLPSVAQGCSDVNNDPTVVLGRKGDVALDREQHKGLHKRVMRQESWAHPRALPPLHC